MAPRLGGVRDCAFVTTAPNRRRPCPWHRPCLSVPLLFFNVLPVDGVPVSNLVCFLPFVQVGAPRGTNVRRPPSQPC